MISYIKAAKMNLIWNIFKACTDYMIPFLFIN